MLSFGTRLPEVLKASETLKLKGISPTIIDARFAKPLDEKLIIDLVENHEAIITIEEGSIGGFGSHVQQFLFEQGVFDKGLSSGRWFCQMFLLISQAQKTCTIKLA